MGQGHTTGFYVLFVSLPLLKFYKHISNYLQELVLDLVFRVNQNIWNDPDLDTGSSNKLTVDMNNTQGIFADYFY